MVIFHLITILCLFLPYGIISTGHPPEHSTAVPRVPVLKWLTGDKPCVTQGSTPVTPTMCLQEVQPRGTFCYLLNTIPHCDSTPASEGGRHPPSCGVMVQLPPKGCLCACQVIFLPLMQLLIFSFAWNENMAPGHGSSSPEILQMLQQSSCCCSAVVACYWLYYFLIIIFIFLIWWASRKIAQ